MNNSAYQRYAFQRFRTTPQQPVNRFKLGFRGLLMVALLGACFSSGVSAQNRDDTEIVDLGTLQGAAEIDPPLKYIFANYIGQPVRENAAFHYQRAMRRLTELDRSPTRERFPWETEWLELTPEELMKKPVKEFLEQSERVYKEIDRASRCTYCEWMLDLDGEGNLGSMISLNLDDLQDSRRLARYLQIKMRYALMTGDYDGAAAAMRAAYKLSNDVRSYPLIITGLIGGAVHGITNAEVARWISREGSPNLYWALSSLGSPAIDLTPGIISEMRLFFEGIRAFKNPETIDWTAEQWATSLAEDFQSVFGGFNRNQTNDTTSRLAVSAMILRGYPLAKRALLESGYTSEQLDAMPVAQVVCIHQNRVTRQFIHEQLKWQFVPNPLGSERMQAETRRANMNLGRLAETDFSLYFLPALIPAFQQVKQAEVRLQRESAALKVLEAIRMHVASAGSAPADLGEIEIVPVPVDPSTGKPFRYKVTDESVELILDNYLPGVKRHRIYRWTR